MNNKLRGMLLGSLVGDAFALGAHWIYDIKEIENAFGVVEEIVEPLKGSYHVNKVKGDLTHYGDQTMILMNYMSEAKTYDQEGFKVFWLEAMKTFKGYEDHAIKESIKILKDESALTGSSSNELGGAARMAPLIYKYSQNKEKLLLYIMKETSLTHTDSVLLNMTQVIVGITLKILEGESMEASISHGQSKASKPVADLMEKALERIEDEPKEVITDFGQSCASKNAFPIVIYLLAKYPNDYKEALIQNVMGGGDSAARGMILGMILGAHNGEEAIPKTWLEAMNVYSEILDWM